MKAFIWFGMLFLAGLLSSLLSTSMTQDFYYSYNDALEQSYLISTISMLIVGFCVTAAKSLCLQLDISRLKKKAQEKGISLFQYTATDVPPEILQKLEEMEASNNTIHDYLKKCRNQRLVTKVQARILEDVYVSGMYRTVESGSGSANTAMPQKTSSADSRDSGISEEKSGIQLTRHSHSGRKDSSAG